jgi:hypothetical protein
LAGATKSSRISEKRKKRSGHVVARCIKNCFIEGREKMGQCSREARGGVAFSVDL